MSADGDHQAIEMLSKFGLRRDRAARIRVGYGAAAIVAVVLISLIPVFVGCLVVGGASAVPIVLAVVVGLFILFLISTYVFAALKPERAILGGTEYVNWHRQDQVGGVRSQPAAPALPPIINPSLPDETNDAH